MPGNLDEHLDDVDMSIIVMSALGISLDSDRARLGFRHFAHLADCEACRRGVAELSAIVAGDSGAAEVPFPGSLEEYRVVPFVLAAPLVPPLAAYSELSLAAETESVIERLPAFGASRVLRSEDGRVELTVAENLRDDTCRVYVKSRDKPAKNAVSFYMPPGVICVWPSRSYFEYPRFAFKAAAWDQVKLLYPRGLDEPVPAPGAD